MSAPELRAESQRRGLGTARSRAELIERLTTHDDVNEQPGPDGDADAPPQTPAEETPAIQAAPAPEPTTSPAGPLVFSLSFPATPGGPDEEDHLAYRQTTRQAAIDAGHSPRGDARRTGTVDGHEVYEITVRRAP